MQSTQGVCLDMGKPPGTAALEANSLLYWCRGEAR